MQLHDSKIVSAIFGVWAEFTDYCRNPSGWHRATPCAMQLGTPRRSGKTTL